MILIISDSGDSFTSSGLTISPAWAYSFHEGIVILTPCFLCSSCTAEAPLPMTEACCD